MKRLLCDFNDRLVRLCACLLTALTFFSADAHGGFLYRFNIAENNMYGYSVNERTGALTPLAGFPVAVSGSSLVFFTSRTMTVDSLNNRLYLIMDGSNTVNAYSVDTVTGALAPLPFSPITLPGGRFTSIAVNPAGTLLAVADSEDYVTYTYAITPTSATFIQGITSPDYSINDIIFSRDGNYFYRSAILNYVFSGFGINAATGVMTQLNGSPFSPSAGSGLATDSQGRIFGITGVNPLSVRAFTTNQGVPALVSEASFGFSGQAFDAALNPNERFYVITDRGFARVQSVKISGTGASTVLTPLLPAAPSHGSFTNAVVFNQAGTFLFSSNDMSANTTTYDFNKETGAVIFKNVQPVGANGANRAPGIAYLPTGIAVFLSGRITDADGRPISGVRITAINQTYGTVHTTLTNPFGYYVFDELIMGRTYTLEARHKQFAFAPQTFAPNQEFNELNFTASP